MSLTAEGAAINQDFVTSILTMRATVYTRATTGPTIGQYTVVAQSSLACRLDPVSANSATTLRDRAALSASRVFRWDATYDLPRTGVQIAVDAYAGDRWNPVAGTDAADDLPGIGTIGKTVLVERAS